MRNKEMNYKEAVNYIDRLQMFAKKHSLDHTRVFLSYLGMPQREKKIIHVAGTNGKGSVCRYLQALLTGEGKKTGLFTSPHLVTIRERIRIGEEMISEEQFVRKFEEVRKAAGEMEKEGLGHPTYFEFLFGMAMKFFDEEEAEYIILETGLGGRLDATNSIEHPVLTVITSIGMDHTEILGDTIEKIAAEKAGIIKPGVPLICDATDEKALGVLKKTAENAGAECREISENAFKIMKITGKDLEFSTSNRYDDTAMWKLPTTASYQPMNAVLALEAMKRLVKEPTASWRKILETTSWKGRMEEALPGIVLDGAHNMPAVRALAKSIRMQEKFRSPDGKLIVLFSAVKEKDYHEMIRFVCREIPADLIVVTKIPDERGVNPGELQKDFAQWTDSRVVVKDTVKEACSYVTACKREQDQVYCFGSLYLVGEMETLLREAARC